jgi:hypothetical protein
MIRHVVTVMKRNGRDIGHTEDEYFTKKRHLEKDDKKEAKHIDIERDLDDGFFIQSEFINEKYPALKLMNGLNTILKPLHIEKINIID